MSTSSVLITARTTAPQVRFLAYVLIFLTVTGTFYILLRFFKQDNARSVPLQLYIVAGVQNHMTIFKDASSESVRAGT